MADTVVQGCLLEFPFVLVLPYSFFTHPYHPPAFSFVGLDSKREENKPLFDI